MSKAMEPGEKLANSEDILKDQANKENRGEKPTKSQRKKHKDKKRQKQEEDLDADILALINSKEVAVPQPQPPEKRKVGNCPHIGKNDEYSFMCSTCRIICCEVCLKDGHEGHKWCELVPYIPSEEDDDAETDYHDHNDGVYDSPEEEIHINTNGRRRLKGGFVNTRKPRSKRDKNCPCRGCKHNPRHLKRIVPIDESRFNKPSDLLAIDNGPSKEDGSGKKKKKKKKKGKQSLNEVVENSGDEQKDSELNEDKDKNSDLFTEDSEMKSEETNCNFYQDKLHKFSEEETVEQNEVVSSKEQETQKENERELSENLSVECNFSEVVNSESLCNDTKIELGIDNNLEEKKNDDGDSSTEAITNSIKVQEEISHHQEPYVNSNSGQQLTIEDISEAQNFSESYKPKEVFEECSKTSHSRPRPLHECYEKEIRAELEKKLNMKAYNTDELDDPDQSAITLNEKQIRAELEKKFKMKAYTADKLDDPDQSAFTLNEKQIRAELEKKFKMKAYTADELDDLDQSAITLKLEIKREENDGKTEFTKTLTIDRSLNKGYMEQLKSRGMNDPEFSPDECGEFARKLLEEDDDPEVTDVMIKDLCRFLKREEEKKRDNVKLVDDIKTSTEPKRADITRSDVCNEYVEDELKKNDIESDTFIKTSRKSETVDPRKENNFEASECDLLTPASHITDFIKIDSVTKAKFFDAFRVHFREKEESKVHLPLWKKELQAKLEKYDSVHGFTKAVKDWLKLPSNDRLYSIYDGWKIVYDENPRRIIERLAPTERERFIKQMKKVLEKCLTSGKMSSRSVLEENPDDRLTLDNWKQNFFDVQYGVNQIIERFLRAHNLKLLAINDTEVEEQLLAVEIPDDTAFREFSPKLVNGHVKFGEFSSEIKLALAVLGIPEADIENINEDLIRNFLDLDLSRDGLMKKIILKGIPMPQVLNKVKEDPKDWLSEVDEKEMKEDKHWETFINAERQRLSALKDEFPWRLSSWIFRIQRNINKDGGKEALQILQEGRSIFPFVGSDKKKTSHKQAVPDDIYAICSFDNTVWVHKTGCDNNLLLGTKGNVKKEVDFGTSIEDFTTSLDGMLLASDPCEYRIISLKNVQNSYVIKNYIQFDKLMPLGIEATNDGNIIVCLVENYYRYDVKENPRRLVAKVTPEGKFLGQIEWRSKGERWFTVPRRAAEAENGDVAVIDRYRFDRGRVIMFKRDGGFKHQWAGHSEICNKPFDPRDMMFDTKGRLFVVDYSNNVVLMFDLDYERITIICHDTQMKGLAYPLCISRDKRNQLWIGCKFGKVLHLNIKKEIKIFNI